MGKNAEHPTKISLRQPPRIAASALVQTGRFFIDPFQLLQDGFQAHGDIFSARILGVGEWVFLCSPDLVRQMFKAPAESLSAGEVNRNLLGFMLGLDATFTLDGEAHRRRHRLVHPHLNGRKTHQHIPTMREVALRALANWPMDRPFAFLPHAHRMSLDVMTQTMFGQSGLEKIEELSSLFHEFAAKSVRSPLVMMPLLQIDLGALSPWGKVLRLKEKTLRAFAAEIAQRNEILQHEDESDSDIVNSLAHGGDLSNAALLDEIINLLFAGHETTGNALAWCMETLHSHPEILECLRRELDDVLRGQPIEAVHLPDLKYLHATIHETIRYRPLAPMAGMRRAQEPLEIGGYLIPEGFMVTQAFPVMARRPDLFKNPEQFDPQHFYERKFRPFEWNPFGGGTRMCIGKGLAEVELKVVLATLLQHAEFQLAQDGIKPVRSGHFFSPSQGLQVTLKRRAAE